MIQSNLFGVSESDFLSSVDLIVSVGSPYCCMADAIGLKTGVQSGTPICKNHKVDFIDNNFMKYNHDVHISTIKQVRPKYATVRDSISEGDCKKSGIKYYSLEEIVQMYDEVKKYTENVILIPKYKESFKYLVDNCCGKFLFGYPMATSYGQKTMSNDLSFDDYLEYDVGIHLLGGSPKNQVDHIKMAQGKVKSLDNNYMFALSPKGIVVRPDKNYKASDIGIPQGMDSIMIPAMAISICSFRSIFNQKWKR